MKHLHSASVAASATAALALIAAAPALAQTTVFELDEIVFSAALDTTTLDRTGASVSVVTREDLEATGETRVIDYLARLPGVDVRARGPIGSTASITIRGAGQNYVRVLVDGIDVTDSSGPQVAYDFGSLTTMDIERIELLRGGQSALYGSEAIGGVINITTRKAQTDGVTQFLTFEAGSYNTLRGSYGISVDQGDFDYSFTLSRTQTDGFSAADENAGNTEADGYMSNRLSFSVGQDFADGARVGINGFYEVSEAEFDEQFPIGDGSPDDVTNNKALGLRAYVEMPTGMVDSTLTATYYRLERDVTGTSGGFGANNIYTGERLGLSYLGVTELTPTVNLRFGIDASRETYSQSGDYGPGNGSSESVGVFGEVAWSPSAQFDLAATLRYDTYTQFGGLASGRIAASWRPNADWIVRASAAQSFRAPSLYELYGPFGTATLKPEQSQSVDFGVERRFGTSSFARATLFYNGTTDLIDFPFPYAQIAGTVRRQGVELEFGAPISQDWRLETSYTYTEGSNPAMTAGNAWNAEYPAHDVSLTLSGDITDRLAAALTVQTAWQRPTLGDYAVANASFTYEIADDVDAYIRIENLFNEEYQLLKSYGTSDRAVYIGLRSRF